MNQTQRKHLRERTEKATSKLLHVLYDATTPMPPEVAKAKKVYDAWREKDRKANAAKCEKVRAAAKAVQEIILFGEPTAALAAVKKFEAMKVPA